MPKPKMIEELEKRTSRRQIAKLEYDDIITLSANRDNTVRLLDEGAVIMANGRIDFYIERGAVQSYYDNLPDDFVGHLDIGHLPFANFPVIIGTWTKSDLTVVTKEDGRDALDVNLDIDVENPIVRGIAMSAQKYGYDLAVSVEMNMAIDEETTEDYGILMVKGVNITGIGLVGDPGNVNSTGVKLQTKGEPMAISMKELSAKLNVEGNDLKSLNDAIDKLLETPSAENAEQVEEQLEATEEAEKDLEVTEKSKEVPEEAEKATEEASLNAEEAPESEETDEAEEISLSSVLDAVNGLKDQLTALRQENEDLRAQLAAKDEEAKAFVKKFMSLDVALSDEPKPVVKQKVGYTDGIGEW